MTTLIDLAGGFYADLMLDASIGGFPFSVINLKTEDGRRIQAVLFPGQDRKAFQDLGQLDGEIVFTGLMVGDDAVHQAERLRNVFQRVGTMTLDHPFFDTTIQVVATKAVAIEQDVKELRVARFTATVERWLPRDPPDVDTLQGILDALADLQTQVRSWLRSVLRPLGMVLAVIGFVDQLAQTVRGTWDTLAGAAANTSLKSILAPFTASLGLVNTLPIDSAYPDAVADRMAAPSAAVAAAGTPDKPAAVAPGGSLVTPDAVDPRVTTALLLSAAATMAPADTTVPGSAVTLAAMAYALGDAVLAASDIPFQSQQDALSWQARLNLALDQAAGLAAQYAQTDPINAGPVWRALLALRAALAADMTATIGRLPAVKVFISPAAMPVWLLAMHLSGDTPDRLVAVYRDLLTRNDIAHPAFAPAGKLEVLL